MPDLETRVGELETRVTAIETHLGLPPPPPDPEPEPEPEPTPPPERQILGGWRLIGPFYRGGMAINWATRKAYIVGERLFQNDIVVYDLPEMGTGADSSAWPVLYPAERIPYWWGGGDFDCFCNSLCIFNGKLWAALRKFYDIFPPSKTRLYARDGETIEVDLPRQSYSGFVKQGYHSEGNGVPLIGCGGGESGQGAAFGPTLGTMEGEKLIHHDYNPTWFGREKREPNYWAEHDSWVALNPRMNEEGVLEGRWAYDRIFGGGLVLLEGITYWPWMGEQDINYARQNETFSDFNYTYEYRYDFNYQLLGWTRRPTLPAIMGHEFDISGNVFLCGRNVWQSGSYQVDPAIFQYG